MLALALALALAIRFLAAVVGASYGQLVLAQRVTAPFPFPLF